MIILIDASNIWKGGGLTHLKELLWNFNHNKFPNIKIVVFSRDTTLKELPDEPWLKKVKEKMVDSNVLIQAFWRYFYLPKRIKEHQADLLFVPGGVYFGRFQPAIVMSQNMLVFDQKERQRFGFFTWHRIKLKLLYFFQSYSFTRAKGIIFISKYARQYIKEHLELLGEFPVIYHGIEQRFFHNRKKQKSIDTYTSRKPFKLLYVSVVEAYKHQWVVAEAIEKLRREGFPVELNLVGGAYKPALRKLKKVINLFDAKQEYIKYHGKIKYEIIEQMYKDSDAFIFASTCENMPNILVEAMAAGLPIISSNYDPMPEILGDAGVYFDPTEVDSTVKIIKKILLDSQLREDLASKSLERAVNFSWNKCADSTFQYIEEVFLDFKRSKNIKEKNQDSLNE